MTKARIIPLEKRFLSSKEAQAYLGMKEDFFTRLRNEAKIHYYRVGRCVFYEKNDLDQLVLNNKVI